jgi:2-amino-4-hydroxy-6-hydroxymethyldihydropteridine diphosphokinase
MDKVFIEALEIDCVIGIYDWERKIKQPVVLDIEMDFDNRKPAASDDIADTLDYKAISKRLIEFVGESSFGLVETLAENCCRIIIDEFGVAKVRMKLNKIGAVRGAKGVGVILERARGLSVVAQEKTMSKAYLSLGSNQDPERHLSRAIEELRARFGAILVSPCYRTPAEGFDGPDFLNCAAIVDTDLDVVALDAWLHALEDAHGRRRDVPRFSSRPLDIDVVFYDTLVFKGPGNLEIPRPELRHAFVLKPLADIAPDFRDPLSGETLATLWSRHPDHARPPPTQVLPAPN